MRADGVTALTIYLVALVAIPAHLVVAPLGGAGAPAVVVAMMCTGWWLWYQVRRVVPGEIGQPVRTAYFLVVVSFTASYAVAMFRPISGTEYSTAHLGMVMLAGWGGVLLVGNDGAPSLSRLLSLARRTVAAGGGLATLGVLQFFTGQQIVDRVHIPGLSANGALVSLGTRDGFARPAGTALHPIEYGAVLTMLLPIAVALALDDRSRSWLRRWYPIGIIALAIPLSISRSALVSALAGILVLAIAWTPTVRRLAAAVALLGTLGLYIAVPGVLGSLTGLFVGIHDDTSAQSRTGSYDIAGEFISRSPWLGRGFATFLPAYRILDNQLLGLLIEVGVVGLVSFLVLLGAGVWCGVRARRLSPDPLFQGLGQGLAGGLCAALCSLALFDGLGFPMSGGMLFVVLGLAGGLLRLVKEESHRCPPP